MKYTMEIQRSTTMKILLLMSGLLCGALGTGVDMRITATPGTKPSLGEELQIQCTIATAPISLPHSCRFEWTHAYFPSRDGPIIEIYQEASTSTTTSEKNADRAIAIYDVPRSDGRPHVSLLVIPSVNNNMQGIFRCALMCPEFSTGGKNKEENSVDDTSMKKVAEASIQIRLTDNDPNVWVKKDLAMMMVSAVLIIFVVCMLLTGLVLRLRHCHVRREFEREQERRRRLSACYDDTDSYTSSSLSPHNNNNNNTIVVIKRGPSSPPCYSEISTDAADDFLNTQNEAKATSGDRRPSYLRQDSTDSTGALCDDAPRGLVHLKSPSKNNQTTEDSATTMRTLCLSPKLLEARALWQQGQSENSGQDMLYTLMDHSDCFVNFDRGVLAFNSPPDYEEAVEEMEKRGVGNTIDHRTVLSPMPPAYSELSLHV